MNLVQSSNRQQTKIRIYFSSPGDVKEERSALESVVADLQSSIGREHNILLELVRWEKSALPAMGLPQEVINQQVQPYDIFIGILWTRFGTPTGVYDSGTEEEFRRALDSWQMLGRPHTLFYFCDRPVKISEIDTNQLSRVAEFKNSISEPSKYYIYLDANEFKELIRERLSHIIPKLAKSAVPSKRVPRLFYSYAHEDAQLREELAKHLRVLERNHIIESWYDNMILPGTEWAKEIDKQLEKADIVVLLVSSDFLDSDYCYTVEMEKALQRHEAGTVRVIPIIVRSALWELSPLANLQVLPSGAKPITLWDDRDEAWTDVTRGIKHVASEFSST
ncbi:MAG: TIR domain-containing protein [Anaerolineae bacterium]|nr:TIR domain-containing protein [Anaerolineae bacterium]